MAAASCSVSLPSTYEYTPYSALKPFTTTLVGILNTEDLNIRELLFQLPITEIDFVMPAEGKKVKIDVLAPVGGIVSVKMKIDGQKVVRGIDTGKQAFNNCASATVCVPDAHGQAEKYISWKQFRSKFQTTGSLTKEHTLAAWDSMYSYMRKMSNLGLTPEQLEGLRVIDLKYEMVDISFPIGYKVNREMLRAAANQCKTRGFHIIWEPGVHSNGVLVKYPLTPFDGVITRKKKKGMPVCVTFIVFSTGNCIVSGPNPEATEKAYDLFQRMMIDMRPVVEWRPKI
jgi:hypothetical protein